MFSLRKISFLSPFNLTDETEQIVDIAICPVLLKISHPPEILFKYILKAFTDRVIVIMINVKMLITSFVYR